MTQLTLFSQDVLAKQPKRERHNFDSYDLAARFATTAKASGQYTDVFIVKVLDQSVVITESEL